MLKEYIYDRDFQTLILKDMINILNYTEIISFSSDKIIVKYAKGSLVVNGKNLVITKLLDSELLVKGIVSTIEFR